MKERFFSYTGDWAGYDRHETAEAARAAVQLAIDVIDEDWDPVDTERWCWGELREVVEVEVLHTHTEECADEDGCPEGFPFDQEGDECADCTLVPVPDTEAERLRAELASLQTKVRAIVANFRREADLCRQPETYNLSRSDAFEDAADRAIDILGDEPADERAD